MGRQLTSALVLAATGGALFAASADAQLFERRQDFFPFSLFGDRGPPPPSVFPGFRGIPPPSEGAKAPPPRKAETPPTSTVLVIGNSLADWLAYGLEEALTDTPEIGVVRKIRPLSGLVRYEARNEAIEWPQAVKEMLAGEQPGVIVVMLGLNDRQALRERINPKPQKQETAAPAQGQGEATPAPSGSEPAQQSSGEPAAQPAPPAAAAAPASEPARPAQMVNYEFHTDKWTEAYTKRVDEMIVALKAKGVPVLWVGLPALRTRTNSDITYLDEIYRARAARAGIVYVDVWDGFVDDQGRFAVQGPDFEGQIRRLRAGDGVHFTKAGAVKLAHYVEHDLRRVMSNRPVPVALPGTDERGAQSPRRHGARGRRHGRSPQCGRGRDRRPSGRRRHSRSRRGGGRSDGRARAQPRRCHSGAARRPRRQFLLAARRRDREHFERGGNRAGRARARAYGAACCRRRKGRARQERSQEA